VVLADVQLDVKATRQLDFNGIYEGDVWLPRGVFTERLLERRTRFQGACAAALTHCLFLRTSSFCLIEFGRLVHMKIHIWLC
jgi:hypothetical protein